MSTFVVLPTAGTNDQPAVDLAHDAPLKQEDQSEAEYQDALRAHIHLKLGVYFEEMMTTPTFVDTLQTEATKQLEQLKCVGTPTRLPTRLTPTC